MGFVKKITEIIMRSAVEELCDNGFKLNMDMGDGKMGLPAPSWNRDEVFAAMWQSDEDFLYVYDVPDEPPHIPVKIGWVRFVYGNNGWDVICDYTTNLEKHLTKTNALAQEWGPD